MIIFLIIVFIAFNSCVNTQESQVNLLTGKESNMINLTKVTAKEKFISDLITNVKYIPLEINKKSLLMEVRKVEMFKDNIFILDTKMNKLYVFNFNGIFINNIGNWGNGPGEINKISDFAIDKKNNLIMILDGNRDKLLAYKFDGTHIWTIKLKFNSNLFLYLGKSNFVFYDDFYNKINKNLKFTYKNEIIYEMFEYPEDIFPISWVNISGGLKENYEGFLYSQPFSMIIYQITKKNNYYPKYKFLLNNSLEKKKCFDFKKIMTELNTHNISFLGCTYQETNNALIFEYVEKHKSKRGLYKKSSKDLYIVGENLVEDIFDKLILSTRGIYKDDFITVIWPHYYKHYLTIANNCSRKNNTILDIIKQDEKNDNPIIMLYKVKN